MNVTIVDTITIKRVANGWVISPGIGPSEFTHVATTPEDVAEHARAWARAQVSGAPLDLQGKQT